MADGNTPNNVTTLNRERLASWIIIFSIIAITILAGVSIATSQNVAGEAKAVLATVLPLFGTWVGTVLAYYFSKENFDAATRSVTELVGKVTAEQKLASIPAKDKWIARAEMFVKTLPEDKIKLVETLEELEKTKKGSRIPTLNDQGHPAYMVHRSMIDRYLADQARKTPPPDPATLTFKNLLTDDPELGKWAKQSFAVIKEDSTLAEAKSAMERISACQDVFVTRGGTESEPVIGWVTNVVIAENAKV
jgi:hypothetical protein